MIRRPKAQDVPAIVELIAARAGTGEILPRSLNHVYQNIRDFLVAEEEGRLAGCGALHILWSDLGEIRGVASDPKASPCVRDAIVRALLDDGRALGLPSAFAFTYVPEFYLSLGFRQVERDRLPRIAWRECIDCPRFPAGCDETAVWLDL